MLLTCVGLALLPNVGPWFVLGTEQAPCSILPRIELPDFEEVGVDDTGSTLALVSLGFFSELISLSEKKCKLLILFEVFLTELVSSKLYILMYTVVTRK